MKTLSKKELASKMGVSPSTLQKLLNIDYFDELVICGYHKNLKILSPRMIEVLKNNWGDFEESI